MRKFNLFKGVKAIMALAVVAMGLTLASCEKEDFIVNPGVGNIDITITPTPAPPTPGKVDKAKVDVMLVNVKSTTGEKINGAYALYDVRYNSDGSVSPQVLTVTIKANGYEDLVTLVTIPTAVEPGQYCVITLSDVVLKPVGGGIDHGGDVDHGGDIEHGHGGENHGGGVTD